jgi:hypothetical protein
MDAETHTAVGEAEEGNCWCCGRVVADAALVRPGNHPEVGVCFNCVRFLGRRARDYQASQMRRRFRGTVETVRREVMARQLHQRPVIGPALRWVNRHLPW